MRLPGRFLPVVLAIAALTTCGEDRSGGPKGEPADVVRDAPARTLRARAARVAISTPSAVAEGRVDLQTGEARLRVRPSTVTRPPELTDPMLAVEIVRGAVSVDAYGGAEVRGASTHRYELDVSPPAVIAGAPEPRRPRAETRFQGFDRATFYADVWVDSAGRIRRVAVPIDLAEKRPSRTNRILAKLVIVDFYDFEE